MHKVPTNSTTGYTKIYAPMNFTDDDFDFAEEDFNMKSFRHDETLGSVPDAVQEKELKDNFVRNCQKAAEAIRSADVLLLVTGAGFSADSGLAVYNDIANVPAYRERNLDYMGICMPDWLDSDPELFYGFWGQCFNDYRSTNPHKGYDTIARWKAEKNESDVAEEIRARITKKETSRGTCKKEPVVQNSVYDVQDRPAGAFFSFTSNVDAHTYDVFEATEIHECHGNIEIWQCSSPSCDSGLWRIPMDHSFAVDTQTMLAAPTPKGQGEMTTSKPAEESTKQGNQESVAHVGQTKGSCARQNTLQFMPPAKENSTGLFETDWPRCGQCQGLARPAVLMFGDFAWKSEQSQAHRWNLWKETVLDLCEQRRDAGVATRICILEVGCGMNVPTSRNISERILDQVLGKGGEANLLRINPDHPFSNDIGISDYLIPIMSKGLDAIAKIDQYYKAAPTAKPTDRRNP